MLGVTKTALGPGHIELREVAEPIPGPGEVKIAIKAAGVCGTDLHIWQGEYACRPPVILGHEFAGEIVALGEGVGGLAIGDRVTGLTYGVSCGHCRYCLQGNYALCAGRLSIGSGVNGAFAGFMALRASMVRRLPENVDDDCGALTEPLACCVKSVLERASVMAGDVVLVTGPGAIGLFAAQLARAQGAVVIVVGAAADAQRLALARALGADYVFGAQADGVHPADGIHPSDDLRPAVDELTGGYGVDAALECSGAVAGLRTALDLVRKGGQIAQIGLFGRPIEFDYEQIALKELRVQGAFATSASSLERALALMAQGKVKVAPLISDRLPLAEWETGFTRARNKEAVKVLLHP
jgi:L-iditol 2-dehydrogenase